MSKKSRSVKVPRKIYPKTNISKAYYKHLVDSIEHDPLIRHSTMTVASLITAICILLGSLIWFAQFNPGNLIYTTGKISGISSGRTDTQGTTTTFITFDFQTKEETPRDITVRQEADQNQNYKEGQQIKIGYHPKNPYFARNLNNNQIPFISILLWSVPFILMLWFIFVALIRYIKRQDIIWQAAEAADSED